MRFTKKIDEHQVGRHVAIVHDVQQCEAVAELIVRPGPVRRQRRAECGLGFVQRPLDQGDACGIFGLAFGLDLADVGLRFDKKPLLRSSNLNAADRIPVVGLPMNGPRRLPANRAG